MRTVLRRAAVATAALGTLGTGALVTAPTASAVDCTSSTRSVDDRSYSGPLADNWRLTAKMCSYRVRDTIQAWAKLSWNMPYVAEVGDRSLDSAGFRVYLKKHDPNRPDPILRYRTNYFTYRMNIGEGSYTTSTLAASISKYGLADGAWKLNWDGDGDGTKHYGVRADNPV